MSRKELINLLELIEKRIRINSSELKNSVGGEERTDLVLCNLILARAELVKEINKL